MTDRDHATDTLQSYPNLAKGFCHTKSWLFEKGFQNTFGKFWVRSINGFIYMVRCHRRYTLCHILEFHTCLGQNFMVLGTNSLILKEELMPITFSVDPEGGYYIAKFIGKVSNKELTDSWQNFYESGKWIPGLNALGDLSESDLSEITLKGLRYFTDYIDNINKIHHTLFYKLAMYAPDDLPFGISRMYDAVLDDSSKEMKIFKDIKEAEFWVSTKSTDKS